jgi:spermidine synthase
MSIRTAQEPAAGHSRPFLLYLIVTSLLCGGLVMVIEVLGSRVIGPFFGASLFVWTALITVTLVALAAGYSVGGIFADRQRSPSRLYAIILMAGILVLLIPLLKVPVLKLALPLGVRGGALAAASLLFGPALFLLGCVSPFIIKIAAREMANIGRTVGLFSAISTVGSFIGTVCTGFVLIAYFQVNQIFLVVGAALVVIAVGYFTFFRRTWQLLPLILLPLLVPHGGTAPTKLLGDGTRVTRLLAKDSFYGNLQVHDYSFADKRTRELIIDGTTQGGIDPANGMSIYEYAYFLQYLPTAINPGGKRCLAVGLGAGVVPMWYDRQGIVTDVVDIDPDVFTIAHDYFGFRVSGQEHVADARHFLNTTSQTYDYIILDVFNGDNTPFHVMSREALQVLKQRLTPNGVLGINMAGSLKQRTFMTASVVRTLKEVFATVEVYPAFQLTEQSGGVGNLEVFAYDRPPVALDYASLRALPVHPLAAATLQNIDTPFRFPEATPAMVLTDNYNPIDFYDIWMKEYIRGRIMEGLDLEILAG